MGRLLEGRNALITGASRGIGEAIAMKLASEGANIGFSYYPSEEEDKLAAVVVSNLEGLGVKARSYGSDAGSFDECAKLIESVHSEFGSIDIIVNNAGITRDNLLMRMTEEQWDQVLTTNLKSVFNITKSATPILLKQRKGSIVNISSVVGVSGNAGQANYSASKAGIIGFTKSVAKELASRNIRCNAIAPGFIETDMTKELAEEVKEEYSKFIPLKRFGTTEEVANVVMFLASDLSSYVNGQVIHVCGGLNT
ncbi:MAG: 3-oxoacyl-[acyl-carrier-protein] reductase [Bacteroidetes bacterium]|nr:3-oxoacyl-[acyl-carrier-protein] reductase [Bacteroidota bacterium]